MIQEIISSQPITTSHDLRESHIQKFCHLQSEQLINSEQILLARIVYYDDCDKRHKEIIKYGKNRTPLLPQSLIYLRSESWLTEFPTVGELQIIEIQELGLLSYLVPIGYRNKKPEYIQIIANNILSEEIKENIKNSALLLSQYAELYLEYNIQKSEIRLLEQVLHRVGHQLRHHFSLIRLYANNLCLSFQKHPGFEQATIIKETITDIDNNLTELMNCGQGEKLRVTPQDSRKLVLASIKTLEPLLKEKEIQISIPENSTILLIDSLQIKQVFNNILSNAIYFSPPSGKITCTWDLFKEEVLIKISYQGKGLCSEDMQKIFTPFYTRRPEGTGLGLTIAKKIILDHHGNLWAQNLVTGGAQFSIILPRRKHI